MNLEITESLSPLQLMSDKINQQRAVYYNQALAETGNPLLADEVATSKVNELTDLFLGVTTSR